MKVVFSFFSNLCSYSEFYKNKNLLIETLTVSSYLARKAGFSTCLIYDEFYNLPDKYSKVFDEVQIISKKEIDDIKLPNIAGKAISKLFCLKHINEPFIYLDPGVFLYKKEKIQTISEKTDCFVYYNINEGEDKTNNILKQSKMLGLDISNLTKNQIFSDTSIIGGTNYSKINNASDRLLKFLIDNKAFLEKELLDNKSFYLNNICDTLIDLEFLIDAYWLPSFLYSEEGLEVSELLSFKSLFINNISSRYLNIGADTKSYSENELKIKNTNLFQRKITKKIFDNKAGLLFLRPFKNKGVDALKKITEKILI